ncbi:hypothetical protein [Mucilaginibacter sp.]|uniref:hypothetical protein n=1 Tax=Mucilaginibacter sp. TaxID=1882438 RepID=UPI0035BC5D94
MSDYFAVWTAQVRIICGHNQNAFFYKSFVSVNAAIRMLPVAYPIINSRKVLCIEGDNQMAFAFFINPITPNIFFAAFSSAFVCAFAARLGKIAQIAIKQIMASDLVFFIIAGVRFFYLYTNLMIG